ncbi:MAG: phosphate-starvation-inducible PsiE family protein [Methanocellales archaeon]|nr:phosphate-starvation-inducible PsiE family protein [Methanocellales archaeon]MDD3292093.1 phosphate-starvation-inducible PsiE family protein [Methanocellales archaeon]MDD5235330.1 phosphate-starvation-inducible PsiE family protein [Methanocellales archaeon]MDD5485722.1 phosphate-starvation-inducible PsiE family protein [Methanocellales archaeon]
MTELTGLKCNEQVRDILMSIDEKAMEWRSKLMTVLDIIYIMLYAVIAFFLTLTAFASFVVVGSALLGAIGAESPILFIITALKDIFIAIIVVELLLTVMVFIQKEQIDMRLLLGAGLTAMVRKVLLFGVEEVDIAEMMAVIALILVLTFAMIAFTKYRTAVECE